MEVVSNMLFGVNLVCPEYVFGMIWGDYHHGGGTMPNRPFRPWIVREQLLN